MYGMVLMVAVAGSGDSASFGNRGGCNGNGCTGVVAGCDGGGHFRGGCHGGFLGSRDRSGCHGFIGGRRHSCDGGAGCTGAVAGCTGVVVAPAAPVVVAAPCAPACDPCATSCKKREGLFARLCKKKDCAPACATPACSPCAGGVVVVPSATTPMNMPPVTGKKE